uniref:MI domain-containing protein n=1 Tax=Ganoderma boninense TaxID=34458 RepID=A0A5K1K6R2_9APHY|nr:MI domain-containing protein [Ganoderma boninense]
MASAFDIWGVVASVIGLLSLFQFIAAVGKSRLPREFLRTFNLTLEETEGLLRSVEEEGLFADDGGQYLVSAKMKLAQICQDARCLQGDAFTAQTLKEEVVQWWRGLSKEISMCCAGLKALRAQISTTSNERRRALAQRRTTCTTSDVDEPLSVSSNRVAVPEVPSGPNEVTVEDDCKAEHGPFEEAKEIVPAGNGEDRSPTALPPTGTHDPSHPLPDSAGTLPSYRRQNSLPPYSSTPPLSTTIFTRCTITSADDARTTRKLVRAYRRSLVVHNVPWNLQGTQHRLRGTSAAGSAMAFVRPSNAPRHWKLLEGEVEIQTPPIRDV